MTHRPVLLAIALLLAPAVAHAQSATKKTAAAPAKKAPARSGLTTLSGVYTREEANIGKEIYVALCESCHKAVSHTGPVFRLKWTGRPLSELYTYMRTMMPKNEPGSLADEDYAVLLAYMLQMNQMPAGKTYLSTDTTELAKIRIDTARSVRKP
ncbi:MAG TPA: cytochrome c [Gemmatimonadaceae bacterium]|nr:cytochrome c [Gemmatimonadaceae bacterium]